jgi:mannose-6-phosphate isomerase
MGLDGKPRELHVDESLASIDFDDFEPGMDIPQGELLATCAYFSTARRNLNDGDTLTNPSPEGFSIISVVDGSLRSAAGRTFVKGDFLILPAGATCLTALSETTVLQVALPL